MIEVAIGLLILAFVPYGIYTYGIFFGKKQESVSVVENLPEITVIFSAYNEEKNIERRLKNINDCQYPNLDLVIVDDDSTDETFRELKKWTVELGFPSVHLIKNCERKGVSASYNHAIRNAMTEIVVLTDADVLFKHDAIHKIVQKLISDDKIGAVTGDLQPDGARYAALVMEEQYRSVYGDMCEWESAWDSTFNFNGALISFKKSAVKQVAENGADDANLAFAAIRNGYRAVYEKEAVVYEKIPESFEVQFNQKVRRAHGILTSMWENRDLLTGHRMFTDFYVMRMWMYFFSPILLVFGLLFYLPFVPLMAILAIISSMCRAFVLNQVYLIAGLFPRNSTVWESTSSGATE